MQRRECLDLALQLSLSDYGTLADERLEPTHLRQLTVVPSENVKGIVQSVGVEADPRHHSSRGRLEKPAVSLSD